MTPLKITFTLSGWASVPSHPIYLDALLAYQVVQNAINDGVEDFINQQAKLPLEKEVQGKDWVWKASALFFDWEGETQRSMLTRTTDHGDIAQEVQNGFVRKAPNGLSVFRGKYKNWLYPHTFRQATEATAWCIGDKDEITSLLSKITHIGSKRRLGMGQVISIDVEEDKEANMMWEHRVLPWKKDGYFEVQSNIHAPYWKKPFRNNSWISPRVA